MKRVLLGLVALLFVALPSYGDSLTLKSGGTITGEILLETATEYSVQTRAGLIKVKKQDVLSVVKAELDQTADLKDRARDVLALIRESRFVRARKHWEGLRGVRSPVWKDEARQGAFLTELGWETPPEGPAPTFATVEAFLAAKTRDLCLPCEGVGTIDCAACAGRGRAPCPACAGKPNVCTKCSKQGTLRCAACSGLGLENCAACAQSERPGYIVKHVKKQVVTGSDYSGNKTYGEKTVTTSDPCPACRGAARVACRVCAPAAAASGGKLSKGRVACDACGGKGQMSCAAGCDGGLSKPPCAACAGKGKATCPACAGSGKAVGAAPTDPVK